MLWMWRLTFLELIPCCVEVFYKSPQPPAIMFSESLKRWLLAILHRIIHVPAGPVEPTSRIWQSLSAGFCAQR